MKKSAAGLVLAGALVVAAVIAQPAGNSPERIDSTAQGEQASPPGSPSLAESSAYREYSPDAVSSASEGDKVVLFFHAPWCVTCKLLSDDIAANVDEIPEDVRILVVDFDRETALKQQYGVTQQHTLVQLTPDGDLVGKWNLSRTLTDLLGRISEEGN